MRVQPSLRSGGNHTGLATADERLRRGMLEAPGELGPTSRGTSHEIGHVRVRYARHGLPAGTMPPIPRAKRELLMLFDLLGARMQYERMGSRLYEALIAKHEAYGGFADGPDRRDLQQIRDEELAHMRMLHRVIGELDGDPTALTPSANLQAIVSRGIADVLIDPRTSLLDGLDAVIVAELADHEEWIGLIELARDLGRENLVHSFQSAQLTEEEHLTKVRRWISGGRQAARAQLTDGG